MNARWDVLHEIVNRLASRATLYGDSRTVNEVMRDLLQLAEQAGKDTRGGTQPPAGESTEADASFFQPGHSYTHRDGTDFRTVTITTHPNTGEPRALGWIVRNGWHEPAALDPDDWTQYDGYEPPTENTADGGR